MQGKLDAATEDKLSDFVVDMNKQDALKKLAVIFRQKEAEESSRQTNDAWVEMPLLQGQRQVALPMQKPLRG